MSNYHLHPKLLFRFPLLPFEGALKSFLDAPIGEEQIRVLKTIFQRTDLQEAIFIASPGLYKECRKWLDRKENTSKKDEKIILALIRYLSRMSTRCTPFGLFAGIALGKWSEVNNVGLTSGDITRHTRLDMEYLCELAHAIKTNSIPQEHILFYPNNSIYTHKNRLRYIEYEFVNDRRSYNLASVENHDYVKTILNNAENGATISELANTITDQDIIFEDALEFIKEMVNAQIISADMEGNVTGLDMLDSILFSLKKGASTKSESNVIYEQLQRLKQIVQNMDQGANNAIEKYYELIEIVKQLKVPYETNKLFQVDMQHNPQSCILDKKLAGTLRAGMGLLNRLTPKHLDTNLNHFIRAFQDRYESREVPLLEVLDVETGIGYFPNTSERRDITPLIDDIFLYAPSPPQAKTITWDQHQQYFLSILLDALQGGQYEIELKNDILNHFEPDWDDLTSTIAILGQVVQVPEKEGQYPLIFLKAAMGSASKFIGRFTHLDNSIHEWMKEIAEREQDAMDEETIIAEIVHLPQSRVGNILMRTSFRKYEIPFLAQPSVKKEFQIPLKDLLVSVSNKEVILRSKTLEKRIIPVLSIAHNYTLDSMPIYEFLCDLEFQNKRRNLIFSWGGVANQFDFLPRVTFRNLILSRATWQFKKEQYLELLEAKKTSLKAIIQRWQEKWKLPNRILLVEFDNELLVDLNNEWCLQMFIHKIKSQDSIRLTEFLFEEKNALVKNEEGKAFTNEFITIFHREQNLQRINRSYLRRPFTPTTLPRSFPPGSPWVYYKLYAGLSITDEILSKHIFPLAEFLIEENLIDQWFFIRYADPEVHLRLRFHVHELQKIGVVMDHINRLQQLLVNDKSVWRVQVDTYEREIERYGQETMEISEFLFFKDSQTIMDFLHNSEEGNNRLRWYYGLFSIQDFLKSFNFNIEDQLAFIKKQKLAYEKEFNVDKYIHKRISNVFNKHKKVLQKSLNNNFEESEELTSLKYYLDKRKSIILPICEQLLTLTNRITIESLVASYIHMFVNRLFKSNQRKYELILYTFLFNLANEESSRKK